MESLTHIKLGNFKKLLKELERRNITFKPSAFKENEFRSFNLETSLEIILTGPDLNYIGMVSSNRKTDYFITDVQSEYNDDYSGPHQWDCIEDAISSALIQYDYCPSNLATVEIRDGKIYFSDEQGENVAEISVIDESSYFDYEDKFTKQVHSKFKGLLISEKPDDLKDKLRKFSGLKKLSFSKIHYMPYDLPILRSINNFVFCFREMLNKFIEEDISISMAQELFVIYFQTCPWHQLKRNEKETYALPFVYTHRNEITGKCSYLYFRDHASGIYHLNKMLAKDNELNFNNADFLHSNSFCCYTDNSRHTLDEFTIDKDTALRSEPLDFKKTRAYKKSTKLREVIEIIISQYKNGNLEDTVVDIPCYEPEGSMASGWFDRTRLFILKRNDKLIIAKENKEFELFECDYDTAKMKEDKDKDKVMIYSSAKNQEIVIEKFW